MKLIVPFFIGVFWVLSLQAEEGLAQVVLCKNRKVVRTITLSTAADGCRTVYTKAGVDRVIGSGIHESSCRGFLQNVQANLEKAGWSCRDVTNVTRISSD